MKAVYTIPKICPADFDLKKTWLVYFRYTHPVSGERKLFRFRANLNSIVNKRERIKEAEALAYVIAEKLKAGWNPFSDEVNPEQSDITITEILDLIYDAKKSVLRKGSTRTYSSVLNMFKTWLKDNVYDHLYPYNFTNVMARRYIDYIMTEKSYSGKTHNNHLGILKFFFNDMVEREIIVKSPFHGIKEEKEDIGKNFPYNEIEKIKIKNYLIIHNKRIYYACQFVYYCFIRRTELVKLKVGDINWINKTITMQSALSKNRKQESVTIPKAFEQVLLEMGLDKAPKEHYIFGHKFNTCERPILKPDSLTSAHSKALKNFNIGPEKGFYSWKHTGVCDLYNATKDPYLVMQQCRHSDIKITMIYLRSLGLTVNEKIREAVFNF